MTISPGPTSPSTAIPLGVSLDVSAVPENPVGAGRYTVELVRALLARHDVQLTLWARRSDAPRWQALTEGGMSAQLHAVAPRSRPLRLGWEQVRLARMLRHEGVLVHHSPHYTMPERARLARVVTVHDLTFFDQPERHERAKVAMFRRAIRVAARRADALVCVSQQTADRLEALLHPAPGVFVVPHGVDRERFSPSEPSNGFDEQALAELGVRRPYVLFLGTLEPRKAVPVLIEAFDALAG
jgi:glycosyltransferase involved in cell wall biosynthesis